MLFFPEEGMVKLLGFCTPTAVDAVLGFPTESTE
jgi:hypothetical protein